MSHSHSVLDHPIQIMGVATAGAVLGATLAVLLTPRTGLETRRNLRRRSQYLRAMMHNSRTSLGIDANAPALLNDHLPETDDKLIDHNLLGSKELSDEEADHIRRHGEV